MLLPSTHFLNFYSSSVYLNSVFFKCIIVNTVFQIPEKPDPPVIPDNSLYIVFHKFKRSNSSPQPVITYTEKVDRRGVGRFIVIIPFKKIFLIINSLVQLQCEPVETDPVFIKIIIFFSK